MRQVFQIHKNYLVLFLSLLSVTIHAQSGQKPNLLFIITDQQRFDAMSIAGNTVLKTPNIDRLATRGARFKNAYTPCAVCGPARASILTVRTVENTGVITNTEADSAVQQSATLMPMKTFDQKSKEQFGYKSEYYGLKEKKVHSVSKKIVGNSTIKLELKPSIYVVHPISEYNLAPKNVV